MEKRNRNRDVMNYRINWLMQWLEMRNYKIKDERMVFLCIIYNTAKIYLSDKAAKEKTRQINNSLAVPFTENKLQKHIFYSVDKRESLLKYTNMKIKEVLHITDEEYELLDPDKRKREKEERAIRAVEKNERDEEIIALHLQGCTNTYIGKKLGVSRKTVQRKIKRYSEEQKNATSSSGTFFTILSSSEKGSVIETSDELKSKNLFLSLSKGKNESDGFDEQLYTLELLTNTKSNLLILGSGGCGKTYLVRKYLQSLSKKDRAKTLVVAPTWKAASNLNGTTIHRAFGLPCEVQTDTPITEIPKALNNISTLIIDEISMVRVDIYTRMIQILQYTEEKTNQPIRVICIGDLGQLPPVCLSEDKKILDSTYQGIWCFNSPLWDKMNFKKVVLFQQHRQQDKEFSEQLERLKYGFLDSVDWINNHARQYSSFENRAITICPTNDLVNEYNEKFIHDNWHLCFTTYEAEYDGSLTEELPVDKNLQLGFCRIMFLWNGEHYKRGDFAMIEDFSDDSIIVTMERTGQTVHVSKEHWTLANGTEYKQFPMCMATAITVHKAQGCTFDAVNIDRGHGFWMPGQLYVALSRCKSIRGLQIVTPLKKSDVHFDIKALEMMQDDTENPNEE